MSTGYLRWGGWAAVSTASAVPAAPSLEQVPSPALAATASGEAAGQMQCGDVRAASTQAGTTHSTTISNRSEQAG